MFLRNIKEKEIEIGKFTWQFVCVGKHTETDDCRITLKKIVQYFPELKVFLKSPPERSIMFQKGKNSEKWYDFIIE